MFDSKKYVLIACKLVVRSKPIMSGNYGRWQDMRPVIWKTLAEALKHSPSQAHTTCTSAVLGMDNSKNMCGSYLRPLLCRLLTAIRFCSVLT